MHFLADFWDYQNADELIYEKINPVFILLHNLIWCFLAQIPYYIYRKKKPRGRIAKITFYDEVATYVKRLI